MSRDVLVSIFLILVVASIASAYLGSLSAELQTASQGSYHNYAPESAEAGRMDRMTEKDNNLTDKGVAAAASLPQILDQQQSDTSRTFGASGLAQSFKPTLPVLTRVDFYVVEIVSVSLSICSSRMTENGLRPDMFLRSLIISVSSTPRWVEFVFSSPISVQPEETYFIIVHVGDTYYWSASSSDSYSRGQAARYSGQNWAVWEPQSWDFPFKTYGYTPSLTINTIGIPSHSPVEVTLNGRSAGTVYDSSQLDVSSKNILWVDSYCTVNIGIESLQISSIDPNTRYSFTCWLSPYGNSTNNPLATNLLYENKLFTAVFGIQYLTNMAFRDNSGIVSLYPTYAEALAPNGSLVAFSSFNDQWLDNGTWTLERIMYQGNNVIPLTDSTYATMAGGAWTVNCRVFQISFTNSFKDGKGEALYTKPSLFRLTFPNGTTSTPLVPDSYLIQNGTTFWSSITWQESEVTTNTNFDAKDGDPLVNCKVCSLAVEPIFYDNTGTMLVQPSSWVLRYPNGTLVTLSTLVTYNQTQAGSYVIENVIWKGQPVLKQPVSIFLTSDTAWNPQINCTLPANLSLSLTSSVSYVGFKVEIEGNLTCNTFGIPDAPILLSYSVTNGQTWNELTLAHTDSDGGYSAEWMPSATGNYIAKASWAGNSTYPKSTASVSLAIIPYEEKQTVFSAESNSTISPLSFNASSLELSFTLTGEAGTTGYVKVTIAKNLASNIAGVKVYLDEAQTEYSAISQEDSWTLTFTYSHSTHQVRIDLSQSRMPELPPFLIIALVIGIVAIVTLLAVILHHRKRV